MIHPADYDEYHKLIADDAHAVGALLRIYQFQTPAEQDMRTTAYQNNIGFSGADAGFASSIAEQFIRKGYLSDKQITYVKKIMPKYHRQIVSAGFEPVELNKKPQMENPGGPKISEAYKRASIEISNDTKYIFLRFSYPRGDNRFRDVVAEIKTHLRGRRWNPDLPGKPWSCILNIENYEDLASTEWEIHPDLKAWYDRTMGTFEGSSDLQIPGLGGTLMPFQVAGVSFIENRGGSGLIGDDMGLGKTVQALGWLQLHPDKRPALIVCPANVKGHWLRSIAQWLDNPTIYLLHGRANPNHGVEQIEQYKRKYGNSNNKIIVCNYDVLSDLFEADPKDKKKKTPIVGTGWAHWLKKMNLQVIVADEGHYIKNDTANRTKAFVDLAKKVKHKIFLSGTPIENRPIEFFTVLNLLDRSLFPSKFRFAQQYTNAHHNGFGWTFTGAKNREQLFNLLNKRIMIRRMKTEVLSDLPEKIKSVLPMEITNRAEYDYAENNFIRWVKESFGDEAADKAEMAEALVQFEKLKQLALQGKMEACLDWINDVVKSDEKLVVFCHHKNIVDLLMQKFGKIAVKIDGGTNPNDRMTIVDRFNNDNSIKLFIGTLAAREGISLKGVDKLAFIELYWNPAKHDQAEDRIIGIGRGKKGATAVNIYYLLAENTIEEDLAKMLDDKRRDIVKILDGQEIDEKDVLSTLIGNLSKKETA